MIFKKSLFKCIDQKLKKAILDNHLKTSYTKNHYIKLYTINRYREGKILLDTKTLYCQYVGDMGSL